MTLFLYECILALPLSQNQCVFGQTPEIGSVVNTSSRCFHILFYEIKYFSNTHLWAFVLKKTAVNKCLNRGCRGHVIKPNRLIHLLTSPLLKPSCVYNLRRLSWWVLFCTGWCGSHHGLLLSTHRTKAKNGWNQSGWWNALFRVSHGFLSSFSG